MYRKYKCNFGLIYKTWFVLHKNKSILVPTKEIVFLGNIINSETMTVSLPQEKKEIIANECERLLNKQTSTIREVARVYILFSSPNDIGTEKT